MEIFDVIDKVKVLELKESDIVVLTAKHTLSDSQLKILRDLAKQYIAPLVKTKVLVLEEGMDIKVVRRIDDKISSD